MREVESGRYTYTTTIDRSRSACWREIGDWRLEIGGWNLGLHLALVVLVLVLVLAALALAIH
jgi:hypothetical protein